MAATCANLRVRAMTEGDILFSYVPRSGGAKVWWLPILPGILVTIAAIQGHKGVPVKTLALVIGITWLVCGGLAALLRFLGKAFQKSNVIRIEKSGMLFGSFGGIKLKATLSDLKRIEMIRDRTMTKMFVEPKNGSKRMLMAFYGEMSPAEKKQFAAAAKRFGVSTNIEPAEVRSKRR
jgi:hypothetical protein